MFSPFLLVPRTVWRHGGERDGSCVGGVRTQVSSSGLVCIWVSYVLFSFRGAGGFVRSPAGFKVWAIFGWDPLVCAV